MNNKNKFILLMLLGLCGNKVWALPGQIGQVIDPLSLIINPHDRRLATEEVRIVSHEIRNDLRTKQFNEQIKKDTIQKRPLLFEKWTLRGIYTGFAIGLTGLTVGIWQCLTHNK
jgi:hypothetical protein